MARVLGCGTWWNKNIFTAPRSVRIGAGPGGAATDRRTAQGTAANPATAGTGARDLGRSGPGVAAGAAVDHPDVASGPPMRSQVAVKFR